MLKPLILTTAFIATLAGNAHAITIPCNPAVQNWQNGSQNTCPSVGSGTQRAQHVAPAPTPPVTVVIETIPLDEPVAD